MPLFENAFCPVCNRKFEEGDDIVYCPECGTPHHRECYKAVGHCVNRGLHASGYSYYDEMKAAETEQKEAEEAIKEEKMASILNNFKTENEDFEDMPFNPFVVPSPAQYDSVYEKDDQTINGESVADYALTIRTNIPRFIKIFKEFEYRGRKRSWNWGAFVFGSLYLFFRKMYKQGVAFFCFFMAAVFAGCFATTKLAPNYVAALNSFANLYSQNKLTADDMLKLSEVSDLKTANVIAYIVIGVVIILRIIMALYADRFYMKSISDFIKSVNSQLEDGASFVQNSLLTSQSGDLNQAQMKKYYLASRGGTTFFIPLTIGFAGYFLISMAMSMMYY